MLLFSAAASRGLSTGVRAPLIRFRYGSARDVRPAAVSTAAPSSTGAKSPGGAPQSGEAIYDFQIPQRWKRRPISDEEIAYINRGGPE